MLAEGISDESMNSSTFAFIMNKQENTDLQTIVQTSHILDYNISAASIHYILHNLFRGLKPLRRKYSLTINEIIFLNGMHLYCKHVSTCMSQDACLKFIGYYNLPKIKYYIDSLKNKRMIQIAEIIHSYNRYKLTSLGLSVMNEINGNFETCLYDWFDKYSISLWCFYFDLSGHLKVEESTWNNILGNAV